MARVCILAALGLAALALASCGTVDIARYAAYCATHPRECN